MADRKVSVELQLKAGQFKAEAKSAERSVEGLSDKVEELDRDITKIPPDAAKAAAALKLLGGDADMAGRKLSGIGDKHTNLSVLDAKIKETRGEVRKLADEFVKTGDVDVFKKLGDSQGRLSALTKIRKDLAKSVELGVGEGMLAGFKLPGLQYVLAGVGASLAVPLIAGLGGALAGGAGLGIAGLGIAGAVLGDPARFSFAWGQVLGQLKSDFIDATKPFTGETYAALAGVGPLVASWHLDTVFANAAKYAEPLVKGVEGFATGAVKGVGALVDKGGPAVAALSQGMVRLGQAGEQALKDIASGAEGGALALHDTINGVATLIEVFGKVTGAAEKAYGFIREHPFGAAIASGGLTIPISVWTAFDNKTSQLTTTQYGLQKAAEAAGHAFDMQGNDLTALTERVNQATVSTDTLAASMVNKLFTATMNLDQASLGVAESQTRVRDTFEESRKTLSKHADQLNINTKEGQANRESVLSSVQANMSLYQAQIAVGVSAEDAAAAYEQNTAALEANLRKAGLTQQQIDGLIGKYRDIPHKVDTDIAIHGLTDAINDLNTTLRLINGIKDKTVTLTVKQVTTSVGLPVPRGQSRGGGWALGGIRRRAAVGMILPPSDPGTVLSAEPQTGGEALIPLRGISQSRAMSLAGVVGSSYGFSVGGGGGAGNITITLSGGDSLTSAMLKSVRAEVRRGYGGNVQVALGTGSR